MQDGRGGLAEMDRAVALAREAYELNGSSLGLFTLALYHHMGRGMRQDLSRAISLYDEFLYSGSGHRSRWDARASGDYHLLVRKLRKHAKATLHAQEHYFVKAQERVPAPLES